MRALRAGLLLGLSLTWAGCHDDWDEVYAACVAEGRCGSPVGGGDSGLGGGGGTGGGSALDAGDDAGTPDSGPSSAVLSFAMSSVDLSSFGRDDLVEVDLSLSNPSTVDAFGLTMDFLGDLTSFQIISEQCGGSVGAGASCTLRVRLKATDPGIYSTTLRVSATNAPSTTVDLLAVRVGPKLSFAQAGTLDFGAAELGASNELDVVVLNSGLTCAEPLTPSFTTSQFSVAALGTCAAPLDAGTSCRFTARFTPDAVAAFMDRLQVASSNAMNIASTDVAGAGFVPGALSVTPMDWDAGFVVVGSAAATELVVRNTGSIASGPLSFSPVAAPFFTDFDGGGCVPGVGLAGGASCHFGVSFVPTAPGVASASVLIASTDAGSVAATLSGSSNDFVHVSLRSDGGDGVGLVTSSDPSGMHPCGLDCDFDVPRGTSLSVVAANMPDASIFEAWQGGTCSGAASPCSFVAGADAGHLVVGRFGALWPLTVKVTNGAVISDDGLIRCPGACTANYRTGALVRLRASEEPGVRVLGTMNQLVGCTAGAGVCDVVMSAPRAVDAGFTRANVAFITSGTFPTNLGSAAAYDTVCRNVARDAGLWESSADGGRWVAWVSQPDSGVLQRLGAAGGWVRPDGRVVLTGFFDGGAVDFNAPLVLDEYNRLIDGGAVTVLRGTTATGAADTSHCTSWTATSGNARGGNAGRVDAQGWSAGAAGFPTCGATRVYCFEANRSQVLAVPAQRTSGRRAFVSATVIDGGVATATADVICDNEARDAGWSGTFVALRSDASSSASLRLPAGSWYRTDGQPLILPSTSGALVLGEGPLLVPLNRDARGRAAGAFSRAWTGSDIPSSPGAANCQSWTGVGSGTTGFVNDAVSWWKSAVLTTNQACATEWSVYCFEQ